MTRLRNTTTDLVSTKARLYRRDGIQLRHGCQTDDSSCQYTDECGVCGGDGIPAGDCDCDNSQLDALGVCGICAANADADGICDDVDGCVGALDECGIYRQPGAIYECGCTDIPEGDCDCDGNQLDALGVCVTALPMPMPMASVTTSRLRGSMALDDAESATAQAPSECGCSDIPAGDCDCGRQPARRLGRVWW